MLSNGETYNDLGRDYLTRRDTEAETRRLLSRLETLGHSVTINPAA